MTNPSQESPKTSPLEARGFTEPMKLNVIQLKARIQAGEEITLEEIKNFILLAERDLSETKTKRNIVEKQTDIDFF